MRAALLSHFRLAFRIQLYERVGLPTFRVCPQDTLTSAPAFSVVQVRCSAASVSENRAINPSLIRLLPVYGTCLNPSELTDNIEYTRNIMYLKIIMYPINSIVKGMGML